MRVRGVMLAFKGIAVDVDVDRVAASEFYFDLGSEEVDSVECFRGKGDLMSERNQVTVVIYNWDGYMFYLIHVFSYIF